MTATNTVSETTLARMRMRDRTREKERVLRDIDKAWRTFMDSVEGIPESLMIEENVSGDWSVKDVLAHVAAWDRETTRVVLQIVRGDEPQWPIHVQRFNDLNYEADQNLIVLEARNRALSAHKALVEMLDGKSEVRADWIRSTTYEHYPKHTEEILRWRRAQGIPPAKARSASTADQISTPSVHRAQANVGTPETTPPPARPHPVIPRWWQASARHHRSPLPLSRGAVAHGGCGRASPRRRRDTGRRTPSTT